MNRRVLCLWLPNWPIQRVLAAEPDLQGRAVVLETRDPRRGLLVAAANRVARAAGARVGIRKSELAALETGPAATHSDAAPSTCLQWEIRSYAPEDDLDRLCDLAEQAQQFSPLVGLELLDAEPWHGRSSNQPQALLLDISGIPPLFGGEEAMLAEIAHWLDSLDYFAYMSIAETVGAAWAFCNYEIPRRERNEREMSTLGQARPSSRWLVAEAWEQAELLAALPLSALRIDTATVTKLHRLGVRTPGELWQLPRDGVASRLGQQLLTRSDQALGAVAEAIIALHGSPDWNLEYSLEFATLSQTTLGEVLHALCQGLATRLQAAGQGALRCVCRLDRVQQTPLVMQLGLFSANDDAGHLHSLLFNQLEQLLAAADPHQESTAAANRRYPANHRSRPLDDGRQEATPPVTTYGPSTGDAGAVRRVGLQATLTSPIVWEQTQLFDVPEVTQRHHLARLIDTLSGRMGRAQVVEAEIQRDAEPEQAVTYRPLTGRRRDGRPQTTVRKVNSRLASSGAEPKPTDPLRRPTHLFTPPELLHAVHCQEEGPPREFVFDNQRQRVRQHWGPERLESGWWRGPSLRRDYYRVETNNGEWWWIFLDLASQQWFVHGLFG